MLRPIRFFPDVLNFDFMGKRFIAFAITTVIILGSFAAMATKGFNFGIDFAGGILLEVETKQEADLGQMRSTLGNLNLGEVALQSVGDTKREVMIRIQRQEGDERAQLAALTKVKQALGPDVEYRRTELVGPKVGDELKTEGALAFGLAILAIAAYVWFRFEWQFGVGALIATFHDVISTLGLFAITGIEFNLTSVAAILTIAGYSINDTVVEYDRVRENMRKYKKMGLMELLNLSVNETLSRTILTGGTVFVTLLALLIWGGPVLEGFAISMLWGLAIGTFSSIYVAMPVLLYLNLRREQMVQDEEKTEGVSAG